MGTPLEPGAGLGAIAALAVGSFDFRGARFRGTLAGLSSLPSALADTRAARLRGGFSAPSSFTFEGADEVPFLAVGLVGTAGITTARLG